MEIPIEKKHIDDVGDNHVMTSIQTPITPDAFDKTDEEKIYQIVGEPEANIENNKLNVKSPLARALIGKEMGDSVEVRSPGGTKHYEITNIEYI